MAVALRASRPRASRERRGVVGGELLEGPRGPAKDRGHVVGDVVGVAIGEQSDCLRVHRGDARCLDRGARQPGWASRRAVSAPTFPAVVTRIMAKIFLELTRILVFSATFPAPTYSAQGHEVASRFTATGGGPWARAPTAGRRRPGSWPRHCPSSAGPPRAAACHAAA